MSDERTARTGAAARRPSRWGRRLAWGLFLVLVLSRLVFLVPALKSLLGDGGGVDLEARRAELNWVLHGVDPELARQRLLLDQLERRGRALESNPTLSQVDISGLPSLEEIAVGAFADGDFSRLNPKLAAYPSWSYPLLVPLIWPPWPVTKMYYAVVLLACLLSLWWLLVRDFPAADRPLTFLIVLVPISAFAASIATGQVTIPVLLLLTCYAVALDRGRYVLAGVLLGLAALKPTLSAPFALALAWPLLHRRATVRNVGASAATAAVIIAGASGLVWWRVGVDPISWLSHISPGNLAASIQGYGLLPLISKALGGATWVPMVFAACGLGAAALCCLALRSYSLLCQLALLGLVARLWAYHRHYDDLLLIFLLLALWVEARRGSQLCLGALIVLAMSVATPVPASSNLEWWRVGTWIIAAAVLACEARPGGTPDDRERTARGFLVDTPLMNEASAAPTETRTTET